MRSSTELNLFNWQLSIPKTVTRWPPTAKHSYMEDSEMDSLLVDGLRPV